MLIWLYILSTFGLICLTVILFKITNWCFKSKFYLRVFNIFKFRKNVNQFNYPSELSFIKRNSNKNIFYQNNYGVDFEFLQALNSLENVLNKVSYR